MASGMADYSSIIRPKYGGAKQKAGFTDVDPGVATRLVEIKGKGVLYGGTVWLDYTSTQANSYLQMKLDGWLFSSLTFIQMLEFGIVNPRSSIFTLNAFDSEHSIYSVGLSYGITFEEYLDLYYYEKYGKTPRVFYNVIYALI